jgi:hypothetical protein
MYDPISEIYEQLYSIVLHHILFMLNLILFHVLPVADKE